MSQKFFPELLEDLQFQLVCPLLGTENLFLHLFQLRSDIALGIFEGLFADIGFGDALRVGMGDLDVVTKHPVVSHLEVGNPGFGRFLRFESRHP